MLLALVHKQMEITAVENDPDKLDLAANCNSIPSNLHYASSIDDGDTDLYDAVVLINPTD